MQSILSNRNSTRAIFVPDPSLVCVSPPPVEVSLSECDDHDDAADGSFSPSLRRSDDHHHDDNTPLSSPILAGSANQRNCCWGMKAPPQLRLRLRTRTTTKMMKVLLAHIGYCVCLHMFSSSIWRISRNLNPLPLPHHRPTHARCFFRWLSPWQPPSGLY